MKPDGISRDFHYKNKDSMTDIKHIEALVEKYFDGDTSNSEEQLLRGYLATAGDGIPEEWRALKALFAYERAERKPAAKSIRFTAARKIMRYAAVAAIIAITAIPVMLHRRGTPDSYAVIDGKVYTDSRTVMEEAENALMIVAAGDEDPFEALSQIK